MRPHCKLCKTEIWKQHKEFPLYFISNLGRIKTYAKNKIRIKSTEINNRGYERTLFCTNNVRFRASIHRLVAEYFLPIPESYETVNHKDFNKLNNKVCNLEWLTQLENIQHSDNAGKRFKKPVLQKTMDNVPVKAWGSAYEAELGTPYFGTLISRCCLGKQKSHQQFKWEFI